MIAKSLPDGLVLVGVGGGQPKLFEIFDRQMAGALGHPADVERLRQSVIDMAHVEAFTRAAQDVTLRRLVGFGLSPLVKTSFEQLFSAPILAEWLFVELGETQAQDVMMRLHFHGGFEPVGQGVALACAHPDKEQEALSWLRSQSWNEASLTSVVDVLLQAWWMLVEGKSLVEGTSSESERREGWRKGVQGKTMEIGWLDRKAVCPARFRWRTLNELGL